MIWIIGGTSDARKFVESLEQREDIYISVTTDYGKSLLDDLNVIVGKMDLEKMHEFCLQKNINLIIDMTHPFAKIVSDNAKKIAKKLKIEYIRYQRTEISADEGIIAEDINELVLKLKKLKGIFLFTTGSKDIPKIEKVRGKNRFIYRILPLSNSLEIALNQNIDIADIICMKGPFSKEMNNAMIDFFKADYLVMKESGENSGFKEKLESCKEKSIIPIIIKRPEEKGINTFSELKKIIENHR